MFFGKRILPLIKDTSPYLYSLDHSNNFE